MGLRLRRNLHWSGDAAHRTNGTNRARRATGAGGAGGIMSQQIRAGRRCVARAGALCVVLLLVCLLIVRKKMIQTKTLLVPATDC